MVVNQFGTIPSGSEPESLTAPRLYIHVPDVIGFNTCHTYFIQDGFVNPQATFWSNHALKGPIY